MGARERFVLTDRNRDLRGDLLYKSRQHIGIIETVSMGNEDLLLRRIKFLLSIFFHHSFNGFPAPAHLGACDNVARAVAIEDRLDVEHRSDRRRLL